MRRINNTITIVLLIAITSLPLLSCDKRQAVVNPFVKDSIGNTVKTRFVIPEGYIRITPDKNSFAEYLQNLPLKPEGTKVLNYDGTENVLIMYMMKWLI